MPFSTLCKFGHPPFFSSDPTAIVSRSTEGETFLIYGDYTLFQAGPKDLLQNKFIHRIIPQWSNSAPFVPLCLSYFTKVALLIFYTRSSGFLDF